MDLSKFFGAAGAKKKRKRPPASATKGTVGMPAASPACSPTAEPSAHPRTAAETAVGAGVPEVESSKRSASEVATAESPAIPCGATRQRQRTHEHPPPAVPAAAPAPPAAAAERTAAAAEEVLPSGVVLRPCADAASVDELRTLNAGLLPMRYPDRFYRDLLRANPRLCALARVRSSVVGAISARVEVDRATKAPTGALYITTLAVVAPQRRTGLGRAMLASVLRAAREEPELARLDRVELHVHAANDDALAFYAAAGFERVGRVEHYYPRLDPPHAEHLRYVLDRSGGS